MLNSEHFEYTFGYLTSQSRLLLMCNRTLKRNILHHLQLNTVAIRSFLSLAIFLHFLTILLGSHSIKVVTSRSQREHKSCVRLGKKN